MLALALGRREEFDAGVGWRRCDDEVEIDVRSGRGEGPCRGRRRRVSGSRACCTRQSILRAVAAFSTTVVMVGEFGGLVEYVLQGKVHD